MKWTKQQSEGKEEREEEEGEGDEEWKRKKKEIIYILFIRSVLMETGTVYVKRCPGYSSYESDPWVS